MLLSNIAAHETSKPNIVLFDNATYVIVKPTLLIADI